MTARKEMQKQVFLLLGILIFAFVNVFVFDNKSGIGFSAFSTISLMTIGLLSKRTGLRVLAIISYVINIVAALFGFTYIGFLTAVQAIELIFVIWYLYPREHFFRRDTTDKYTYRYRWVHMTLTILISIGAYIGFAIISHLWDDSFLEYGGNTALIFAMQYILYLSITRSRENEPVKIAHYFQKERQKREFRERVRQQARARQVAAQQSDNQAGQASTSHQANYENLVKFASVWLLVMDMSILAYFFRPNDVGFAFGAFFVLLTIVLSLVIKTEENKEDVFSIIYHKIRPVQPVFFILLLIAHAHQFSYGAAYALLFAVAYFFWAINKINIKTLLTLTVIIYFFPVFGYLSNPYRLGAENFEMVGELLTDREEATAFHLGDYYGLLGVGDEDTYYEAQPAKWRVSKFMDRVILDSDYKDDAERSGIWNRSGDFDYDLSFVYSSKKNAVEVTYRSSDDEIDDETFEFKNFDETFNRYQSLSTKDNDNRYQDYYKVGQVNGEHGPYTLFLKMDEDWVKDYKEDPESVDYVFLVFGDKRTAKEAYKEYDYDY